jgi:hypothetical protein
MKFIGLVYYVLMFALTTTAFVLIWNNKNVIHWRADVITSFVLLFLMGYGGSIMGMYFWYEDYIKK